MTFSYAVHPAHMIEIFENAKDLEHTTLLIDSDKVIDLDTRNKSITYGYNSKELEVSKVISSACCKIERVRGG